MRSDAWCPRWESAQGGLPTFAGTRSGDKVCAAPRFRRLRLPTVEAEDRGADAAIVKLGSSELLRDTRSPCYVAFDLLWPTAPTCASGSCWASCQTDRDLFLRLFRSWAGGPTSPPPMPFLAPGLARRQRQKRCGLARCAAAYRPGSNDPSRNRRGHTPHMDHDTVHMTSRSHRHDHTSSDRSYSQYRQHNH